MYSTPVYIFTPRQTVVLNVGNSPRRYNTVYAKNLTFHKGVDNVIQFQFLNQEQKPVDVTGKDITVRIISDDGTRILIKTSLYPVLPLTGIMELRIIASELESISAQKARYSLEIPVGQFSVPVFVGGDAGAKGVIDILDGILPKHTPAMEVGIASHAQPNNNTVVYYSDVINTGYSPVLSIQAYYTGFSGAVKVQGSTVPNSDWYDIGSVSTYLETTESDVYTINGYHPYVRLEFTSTLGNVNKILAR